MRPRLGIRWTIGDVSDAGFTALRLSIAGALRAFGHRARYAVLVNSVPLDEARRRLGPVDAAIEVRAAVRDQIPSWLLARFDEGLTQGTAWKLAPLRVHPGIPELALDNDCVLWRVPTAVRRWLDDPDPRACLVAEDVRPCFGRFGGLCGDRPRNAGVRGLGPAFDLEDALRRALRSVDGALSTELDEQGLQIAALSLDRPPHVVSVDEVAICSPTPPHRRGLGEAGVHFVGVNAKKPWCEVDGRPITELVQAHFRALLPEVAARVSAAA